MYSAYLFSAHGRLAVEIPPKPEWLRAIRAVIPAHLFEMHGKVYVFHPTCYRPVLEITQHYFKHVQSAVSTLSRYTEAKPPAGWEERWQIFLQSADTIDRSSAPQSVQDAYASLHVTRDAPIEVVKAAHRALTKKYHPDTGSGDSSKMQKVNAAWTTLKSAGVV